MSLSVVTICCYDDDVLGLIKLIVVALKDAHPLFDAFKSTVDVGACLAPVAYM